MLHTDWHPGSRPSPSSWRYTCNSSWILMDQSSLPCHHCKKCFVRTYSPRMSSVHLPTWIKMQCFLPREFFSFPPSAPWIWVMLHILLHVLWRHFYCDSDLDTVKRVWKVKNSRVPFFLPKACILCIFLKCLLPPLSLLLLLSYYLLRISHKLNPLCVVSHLTLTPVLHSLALSILKTRNQV